MFKALRIFILLTILVIVAASTYLTKMRTTDWDSALWVSIYPVNGDNSAVASNYIKQLQSRDFKDIEEFLSEEGKYYKIPVLKPVTVNVAPEVSEPPPLPPSTRNAIEVMLWSLKLRYWAYTHNTDPGPSPDVQIFIVYSDPANNAKLPHSLGLEKGHIGVVNVFAGKAYTRKNNVIVTHEFLHTLGAKDKYDSASGYPIYPDGFANPEKNPRFPQTSAEVMAGRMAINETETVFPKSLYRVVVGETTATEINWLTQ